MQIFIQIVILLVSSYVAWALAPKPPAPKPATLDDFDVPRAEEGAAIGVVGGTWIVKSAHLVWWGDLDNEAIKTKSSKK